MSGACRRKSRGGFFAAGEEFQRALEALSDGAFKVYAWACLHAERPSGRLAFERGELARSLGKSRSALGRHLRELERAGVCELESAPNQHRGSVLAVRPAYWPYRGAATPPAPPTPGWRRPGTRPECRWRAPAGRCCWAARASRWRCSVLYCTFPRSTWLTLGRREATAGKNGSGPSKDPHRRLNLSLSLFAMANL